VGGDAVEYELEVLAIVPGAWLGKFETCKTFNFEPCLRRYRQQTLL
jgi:hypothetical protein